MATYNRIWIILSWLLGIIFASVSFEVYQVFTSNMRADLQRTEEKLHDARITILQLQADNMNLTFQLQQQHISANDECSTSVPQASKEEIEVILKEQKGKLQFAMQQLEEANEKLRQCTQNQSSETSLPSQTNFQPPSETILPTTHNPIPEAPCPALQDNTTYDGSRKPLAVDPYLYSLLKSVNMDGTAIVTTANSAFLEFCRNWVLSLKSVGINKYLIVALEKHAYDQLQAWNYTSYFNPAYTGVEELTEWGSAAYREIVRKKSLLMAYILFQGFDLFFIDTDVVFYQNPLPYTKEIGDHDYLIQCDDPTACSKSVLMNTGVVFLKSNWKTLSFISLVAKHQNMSGYTQQSTWNELAPNSGYKSVKHAYFDPLRFANGVVYYRTHTPQRNGTDLVLVHNNWIMGANKIYRFREYNQWFVDPDSYFTTPTQFLTYDVDLCAVTWDQERDLLASAVGLTLSLNRTLILPQFACRSQNLGQVQDLISRYAQDTLNCSMDDTFDTRGFFHEFGSFARENSFLTNSRTPPMVREDIVQVWVKAPDQVCPQATPATITIQAQHVSEIIQQLSGLKNTRIHLLCHDWKSYVGFMENTELFEKLKRGIQIEGLFYGSHVNAEYHMFKPDHLVENRRVEDVFKNTERCGHPVSP